MSLSAHRVSTGHNTGKSALVNDRAESSFADGFWSVPVGSVDSGLTSVSQSHQEGRLPHGWAVAVAIRDFGKIRGYVQGLCAGAE